MCREASLRGRDVTSLLIKRRTKARLGVWIDGFRSNSRLYLALICSSLPLPLICIALMSPHCNNEPISELPKIDRVKDQEKTPKPRQKRKRKDEKKRQQQREKAKPKTKTKDQDQDKRRIE
jgi:hypothetical protein